MLSDRVAATPWAVCRTRFLEGVRALGVMSLELAVAMRPEDLSGPLGKLIVGAGTAWKEIRERIGSALPTDPLTKVTEHWEQELPSHHHSSSWHSRSLNVWP